MNYTKKKKNDAKYVDSFFNIEAKFYFNISLYEIYKNI